MKKHEIFGFSPESTESREQSLSESERRELRMSEIVKKLESRGYFQQAEIITEKAEEAINNYHELLGKLYEHITDDAKYSPKFNEVTNLIFALQDELKEYEAIAQDALDWKRRYKARLQGQYLLKEDIN